MGLAVIANQTGSVDRKDDRKSAHADVMDHLVIRSLQEC